MKKQAKRETAIKNVRIYPSSLEALQGISFETGKTIARIISELIKKA